MATRLYFPSTGAAILGALAYGSGWDKTSQATRRTMVRVKTDSSDESRTCLTTALSPEFHCSVQYQIGGLSAQTISGTVKGQIRTSQNNVSFKGTVAIAIRVVSSDGSVERGWLVGATPAAPLPGVDPPEFHGAARNRSFKDSSGNAAIALSSLAISLNDILVVELGCRDEDIGTSASGILRLNDPLAFTDAPEDETSSSTTINP